MAPHTRPEPMNASPHHSKVKLTLTQADRIFVAGTHITGKLEMECRADQGLGIGVMMVELFAIQELTSRDHSATSTFLHSRRLFQGPGLPSSNAVQAHPMPGDPPLPAHHYQARRGISTFLFRIPIPASSPSSISFGADLATIKYELRASASVFWKGEKILVTCRKDVEIIESCGEEFGRDEPEGVVVGEHGKIWVQGKVVSGVVVAGESACVELQVKNHSNKKSTALTVTLLRTLVLPIPNPDRNPQPAHTPILEVSDTLTTVSFKGPEYIITPGVEGVASLVFDVPKNARGVRSGALEGSEDDEGRMTEPLFEIRCAVGVKLGMGFRSKDLSLEIPVQIVHPAALPEPEQPYSYPHPYTTPSPPVPALYADSVSPAPYIYPPLPLSPIPTAYFDHNTNPTHVWLPPPPSPPLPNPHPHYSQPYQYAYSTPLDPSQQYYFPSPLPLLRSMTLPVALPLHSSARPLSAGPRTNAELSSNLHDYLGHPNLSPGPDTTHCFPSLAFDAHRTGEPEEGKGKRAERVTRHLRQSSRHRSVSPLSHRFPVSAPITVPNHSSGMVRLRNLPPPPINANTFNPYISIPPNTLSAPETHSPSASDVHSPRPVLSPKHSFSVDPMTHNSVSKSERVEALERMAAEVGQKFQDLSAGEIPGSSGDIGIDVDGSDVDVDADINKTLPPPPVPSGKENAKRNGRMRVDKYFADDERHGLGSMPEKDPRLELDAIHPMPSDKTPPTPTLTAITPARLQLHRPGAKNNHFITGLDGTSESGLDALERRLLAEVGTRKLEKDPRPDVRTVLGAQPITIPLSSREKEAEPLNDSAISSLTLAGVGGLDLDRQEHDGVEVEVEMEERFKFEFRNDELDEKHERDSDEKTHRAAKSSVSGDERADVRRRKEERRRRKEKDGEREGDVKSKGSSREDKEKEKKTKRKDKEGEGECLGVRAKKCAAAKGRVTAWLGQIEPEVPPPEAMPPLSPTLFGDKDLAFPVPSPLAEIQTIAKDIDEEAHGDVNDSMDVQKQKDVSSAPNPRSSGFVPIGTLKHDTFQRRPIAIAKDSSVADDVRRIADIWSSSSSPALVKTAEGTSPVLKDLSPVLPKLSPSAPTRQPIRTYRRVSPPSTTTPMLHTSGAITRVANDTKGRWHRKPLEPITKFAAPLPPPLPKKLIQPSPRLPAFPPPHLDPEVKYDIRSARGGRGGQVASVAAIWASQQKNGFSRKTPDFLLAHTPPRSPLLTNQTNPSSRSSSNSCSDSSSGANLVELSARRLTTRTPLVKSSSVPAVISSSHATPILSSTASLARPPPTSPLPYKTKHAAKVPTAIFDAKSEGVGAPKTTAKVVDAKSTSAGDLAFGQARLRDLIKKYQGTAV